MVLYVIVVNFLIMLLVNKVTSIVMYDWKIDRNSCQLLKQTLVYSTS